MRVRDVMTSDVTAVPPGESLKDVAKLMLERRVSGVPVVDAEGDVLGVVSETDLLSHHGHVAGEAMTSPAVTIAPARPLAVAADLMIERGVNRLPVVDAGKLVGILTRADLVRAFVRSDAEIAREIREDVLGNVMLLPENAVAVEVEDGDVALTGELGRRTQAELLPKLARRVAGVLEVRSRLTWGEDDTRSSTL